MTYTELKQAADKLGYRLAKKEPYAGREKHCGAKPHEWFVAGSGTLYKCPICGLQSEPNRSSKQALLAWNDMIRRQRSESDK